MIEMLVLFKFLFKTLELLLVELGVVQAEDFDCILSAIWGGSKFNLSREARTDGSSKGKPIGESFSGNIHFCHYSANGTLVVELVESLDTYPLSLMEKRQNLHCNAEACVNFECLCFRSIYSQLIVTWVRLVTYVDEFRHF